MAQYDLTNKIAPYLDLHLVFPLLEFLQENKSYPENQILEAKLSLLAKTNMVDFAIDIYKKLHETDQIPQEFKQKRESVIAQMGKIKDDASPLLSLIESNAEAVLGSDVSQTDIENLYSVGKFRYECGNYTGAAECLRCYISLTTDKEKILGALWGKLAAEILTQQWKVAMDTFTKLRETIDSKQFSNQLEQLQQRSWLIHWGLFVLFNHPNGRNGVVDFFLSDSRYLTAIQTNCPHILRYLTTAVITNKKRRNVLKDLVKVIEQERYTYRDPITEFLEALCINCDFEVAQEKLKQCEEVLMNDFFLVACRDEFVENARLLIFETYCKIHRVIDINMLAEKLGVTPDAAEEWIVNLIRNAKLDAKIDSKKNQVVMGPQESNIYQQVIEKTKGLSFKTSVLTNNIDKRIVHQKSAHKAQH